MLCLEHKHYYTWGSKRNKQEQLTIESDYRVLGEDSTLMYAKSQQGAKKPQKIGKKKKRKKERELNEDTAMTTWKESIIQSNKNDK